MSEGVKIDNKWEKYSGPGGMTRLMEKLNTPCIYLSSAKLCIDCDLIYDGRRCPKCDREQFVWLSKVLGERPNG